MPQYQAFDTSAEVLGQNALVLLTSIVHEDIVHILHKHGLDHVDANQWYPLQSILDVLSDISDGPNGSANLVTLGIASSKSIYENLPQAVRNLSLREFLSRYNELVRSGSQSNDGGDIIFGEIDAYHMTLTYCVPYPDDVFYGFFYGLVRCFRPQGKAFSVRYDENLLRREEGGDATTLHIFIDR